MKTIILHKIKHRINVVFTFESTHDGILSLHLIQNEFIIKSRLRSKYCLLSQL